MVINSTAHRLITFSLFLLLFCRPAGSAIAEKKIIIADNGAGAKLIEHTLPAVTLAATEDIDYIELHTVMTSDNQLIVFHDLTLNRLTNVANLFNDRSREDGRFYVIDFSLREIQQMRLENTPKPGKNSLSLAIPTLQEELGLIRRLESILTKTIGISLEIVQPRFHSEAGKDISSASLDILMDNGYVDTNSKLFIQCLDSEELQRIYSRLMPQKGINLPLIQLIAGDIETEQEIPKKSVVYSYDWLYSNSGLKIISSYAAAIGLPWDKIVDGDGNLLLTDYITASHKYGMSVFVYSLNNQPENFPPNVETFSSLLDLYLQKANIDGFYTDAFSEAKIITDALVADKKKKDTLPEFFSSLDFSSPIDSDKTKVTAPDNEILKN